MLPVMVITISDQPLLPRLFDSMVLRDPNVLSSAFVNVAVTVEEKKCYYRDLILSLDS